MRPKSKHPPKQKSKDVWLPKYYSTWEVEYHKATVRPNSKHPPRQKSKDVWLPKYYSTWEVEYNKTMKEVIGETEEQAPAPAEE